MQETIELEFSYPESTRLLNQWTGGHCLTVDEERRDGRKEEAIFCNKVGLAGGRQER